MGRVETMSLPAGILGGVSFEKSHITLKDQDLIVMLSDGVIASGIDWLPSEINAAADAAAADGEESTPSSWPSGSWTLPKTGAPTATRTT